MRRESTRCHPLQSHFGQIQGKQCSQLPTQPPGLPQKLNASLCTGFTPQTPLHHGPLARAWPAARGGRAPGCAQGHRSCPHFRHRYHRAGEVARTPRPPNVIFSPFQPHPHLTADPGVLFSPRCSFGMHTYKRPASPPKSDQFSPNPQRAGQ